MAETAPSAVPKSVISTSGEAAWAADSMKALRQAPATSWDRCLRSMFFLVYDNDVLRDVLRNVLRLKRVAELAIEVSPVDPDGVDKVIGQGAAIVGVIGFTHSLWIAVQDIVAAQAQGQLLAQLDLSFQVQRPDGAEALGGDAVDQRRVAVVRKIFQLPKTRGPYLQAPARRLPVGAQNQLAGGRGILDAEQAGVGQQGQARVNRRQGGRTLAYLVQGGLVQVQGCV